MLTIVVMAGSYWGGVYRMCSLVKLTFHNICILYIYILHTSKLICITICLWIFLSTDNVLTLLQYDTRGVQQFYPGKSENLSSSAIWLHSRSFRYERPNELSLTTLRSKEFTLSSGSLGGVNFQIYPPLPSPHFQI